jgi:hypothetical protein
MTKQKTHLPNRLSYYEHIAECREIERRFNAIAAYLNDPEAEEETFIAIERLLAKQYKTTRKVISECLVIAAKNPKHVIIWTTI